MSVGRQPWYHRLHDVLGSVVALTNSAGQVVERYDYDPYGTTTILDAAAVPLALKPIDPAAADGYYHDHDRDGDIDAADYTDLMDCVNSTPYDPMCIYTHDRTGDRRVDIVDVGVYLAYADDQGLAGGASAPELVHYGRPLRLQFDADGDGRVDMFDWYAMQTCFTKNSTRCNYLFDDNGDGVVNFYDLTNFKQAADGPQGGPGATQWRRKLVASRYGNPFMWTGQRYDATTGQYHFWARTYSPRLGRWMQRDPLGYMDGANLYVFGFASPVSYIDVYGLSAWIAVKDTASLVQGFIGGLMIGAGGSLKGTGISIYELLTTDPRETIGGLIDGIRGLHSFIKEADAELEELLFEVMPQLYQLIYQWDALSAFDRGLLIGQLVGKFGADFFTPGAFVKILRKLEILKKLRLLRKAQASTKTNRIGKHLSVSDLKGAARELRYGRPFGGQHLKEVREAVRGLRRRMKQIIEGLKNPRLTAAERDALLKEYAEASRLLDAAEEALSGLGIDVNSCNR